METVILSVVATLAIALLAMAPGWLLMRGRASAVGMVSAAMAASLTVSMLVTALLGIAVHLVTGSSIPALSIVPVSLLLIGAAHYRYRPVNPGTTPIEWQGLAIGLAFLLYGLFVQFLAVRPGDDGALIIHGWFNADWFKHLGHVSALGNFGVPAVDNFNRADTLHYYWLSYILPGAGLAVGNDGWSALAAANSILVMLFGSVFYGVLRHSGASRTVALLIGLVALFASAPISFVYQLAFGIGIEGVLNFPAAPKGPALLTLSQYIPQHLLVIILLLGWFLLREERTARLLSLAALASVMTISTLLGAVSLIAYGLHRLWTGRMRAVPELVTMVLLSGALVLILQVLQVGNFGSAIDSPLLTNETIQQPLHSRIIASLDLVIGNVGLPFLVAAMGLYYWRPVEHSSQDAKVFAIALILSSLIAAIAVEIALTERLAIETRIRAVNLPAIANAIVGCWVFSALWAAGNQKRIVAAAGLAIIVLVALPSAVLRTSWHGRIGDDFTTEISSDDMAVLSTMREETDPRAIVLQYPEPPVLALERGGDAWAAILGQRAVTGNLRATDYQAAEPRIASAERFFAGRAEPIASEVDLVYLSRSLHPGSYELLRERMSADPYFTTVSCLSDACLFQRLDNSSQ